MPFYYYDENRKRRQSSETFDEYADAQHWAELVDSTGIDEALKVLEFQWSAGSQVVLLADWLTRYVDEICRAGDYMQRKYHSYIRNDITPFFGQGYPLDALTPEMDAAWVVHLSEEQGNAPKTVHDKYGFLSGAMNSAAGRRPVPADRVQPVRVGMSVNSVSNARIRGSNASTAEPFDARSYFGGSCAANAFFTVFFDICRCRAIARIGIRSARCNLRISAQSSTFSTS